MGVFATVAMFCERDVAFAFKHAFSFQARESLDVVVGVASAMTLSGQHSGPAVVVVKTRLLADWLRICVGLLPIWGAEDFNCGTPRLELDEGHGPDPHWREGVRHGVAKKVVAVRDNDAMRVSIF